MFNELSILFYTVLYYNCPPKGGDIGGYSEFPKHIKKRENC